MLEEAAPAGGWDGCQTGGWMDRWMDRQTDGQVELQSGRRERSRDGCCPGAEQALQHRTPPGMGAHIHTHLRSLSWGCTSSHRAFSCCLSALPSLKHPSPHPPALHLRPPCSPCWVTVSCVPAFPPSSSSSLERCSSHSSVGLARLCHNLWGSGGAFPRSTEQGAAVPCWAQGRDGRDEARLGPWAEQPEQLWAVPHIQTGFNIARWWLMGSGGRASLHGQDGGRMEGLHFLLPTQ